MKAIVSILLLLAVAAFAVNGATGRPQKFYSPVKISQWDGEETCFDGDAVSVTRSNRFCLKDGSTTTVVQCGPADKVEKYELTNVECNAVGTLTGPSSPDCETFQGKSYYFECSDANKVSLFVACLVSLLLFLA